MIYLKASKELYLEFFSILSKLQTYVPMILIVYYSIGFTKLILEFGGKLAKVRVGRW